MSAKKPYDFVAAGRRGAEARWAKRRAERIAQGLPPTRDAERGTKPDRFDDPELEAYWMSRAEAASLFVDAPTRTARRRIARRLAEAEAAAIAESAARPAQSVVPTDDDVLLSYHSREIARLTAQRAADAQRDKLHARLIVEHETALVEIMRREGRS